MSNKVLGLILVGLAVVVIAGVGAWMALRGEDELETQSETTNTQAQGEEAESLPGITADEVAAHSTEGDCWTIIDGRVYDITSYIARHPGGDEILRACGADASSFFNERKDESGNEVGSGTPHSLSAQRQLVDLQIGTLQ